MAVDALISMSKSLNAIMEELSAIRNILEGEQRAKLTEARRAIRSKAGVLTESAATETSKEENLSKKDALGNIRDILDGKYIG